MLGLSFGGTRKKGEAAGVLRSSGMQNLLKGEPWDCFLY